MPLQTLVEPVPFPQATKEARAAAVGVRVTLELKVTVFVHWDPPFPQLMIVLPVLSVLETFPGPPTVTVMERGLKFARMDEF
ncbi:hypothetical protein L0222_16245 [bacterium]|nr:hypothetical protein [bacterium]